MTHSSEGVPSCFCLSSHKSYTPGGWTTDAFIATLKRFISRRNLPGHIYSDNGSNFIGARNQMQELYKFLSLPSTQNSVKDALLAQRVEWHFIPDRAPHFGGIWEAGVKAASTASKGLLALPCCRSKNFLLCSAKQKHV